VDSKPLQQNKRAESKPVPKSKRAESKPSQKANPKPFLSFFHSFGNTFCVAALHACMNSGYHSTVT
jgi:hypothetical protein